MEQSDLFGDRLGPYLLGPNDTAENGIYTGDARELAPAIPDESADLIFTDPVYQNIDDYRWLAETAARVLKPKGNALAFVNAKWLPFVLRHVPTELPPLAYIRPTRAGMNGRLIARTHYLVWYGSGSLTGYMQDGYIGYAWSAPNQHNHKWTKNPNYLSQIVSNFTERRVAVVDFFTGGGTVPAVCKMLGRRYLAFEIDPQTAESARQRVRETQPPLFVPESAAVQTVMWTPPG